MLNFYLISMVRSEPIQVFIAYTRHIRHDPNHRQQRPETSGSARAVPQFGTYKVILSVVGVRSVS